MGLISRWWPRSLVGRVFALYTGVLLVFVSAGLGLFYRYQFSVELEETQVRAESLVAVMRPAVSDSAVIGDYDTIRRTLEAAVEHSSFASAAFLDLRGGGLKVPNDETTPVAPPAWLRDSVAARLLDINLPINVGGRDYGVLRLTLAPERIAGKLWAQTRIALLLAGASLAGGLLLIRLLLVRWLGNLGRVQAFDDALRRGQDAPALLMAEEAPAELRQTFEVLDRAAASLQQQRAQAASTLEAITAAVFTLDAEGRVLLANPAACAMAGAQPEALRGVAVHRVLPELLTAGESLQPWRQRRAQQPLAGGGFMVVESSLSLISGAQGEVAGYVLACSDVSEQVRLDRQLRSELAQRESALMSLRRVLEDLTAADSDDHAQRVAEGDDLAVISRLVAALVRRLQTHGEQLDAIFALSPDGFVSFGPARCVNYVSPAFTRLTGLDTQQVLGQDEATVQALLRAAADGAKTWPGFAAMRDAGAVGGVGAAGDSSAEPRRALLQLARPVQRVLELTLREGDSPVITQVLLLRDVTHETEVDQMKSEFLSTAAHELRTPMTSIFGFAEMMMMRPLKPEQQREVLATIHRQSQLMISIINELLDLARIEARRGQDFQLERFQLGPAVAGWMADFGTPAGREAPLLHGEGAGVVVLADRQKLQQAVGNVLSNAYKYSPQGGAVQLRVLLGEAATEAPRPGLVGIEVTDQGIGMTPEVLARVSERFFRADASGTIPGTGLGMSIVREITELHGGRLALHSEPGQGTRVTLWLPVHEWRGAPALAGHGVPA